MSVEKTNILNQVRVIKQNIKSCISYPVKSEAGLELVKTQIVKLERTIEKDLK